METSRYFLILITQEFRHLHLRKDRRLALDPGHIRITTTGTDENDGFTSSIEGTTNVLNTISNALNSNNVSLATGSGNYDLRTTNAKWFGQFSYAHRRS